jgi:hypothetical protein
MSSRYELLPLKDQMIIDMTVFIDEMLMRSALRHGACNLSFRLGERAGQLREIYAKDISSPNPKFFRWKDSKEAMAERLANSVVRIQTDHQLPTVKARIACLVTVLENLPYPQQVTGKSGLER